MKLQRDRRVSKRRNGFFGSLEARLSKRSAPYQFESLENRSLLTGSALLQNPINRYDVNADGQVQPLDVLVLVNDINANGIRAVTLASDAPKLQAMGMTAGSTTLEKKNYVDVNGDNVVSALDVLLVAQAQVQPDDIIQIRLVATDLAGNPITEVQANSDFRVEVLATDLRAASATGIFAVYLDVPITGQGGATGTLETDSRPIMDADFLNGVRFNFSNPTEVNETGSFKTQATTPPDDPTAEERIFSFVVHAGSTPGSLLFEPNKGDLSGSDVLIFGSNVPVPSDNVAFESLTIPVVASTLPARVSISPNVSVAEGNTGATNVATLTVNLNAAATQTVTAAWETLSGTAVDNPLAARDFNAASGTVTFNVGESSKTFTVTVRGDVNTNEGNEVFHVNLTTITNALAQDSHATVTITDDDLTKPTVSVSDLSITEGNAGTKNAVVTLTLSAPSQQPVVVNFATAPGSATSGAAGTDFTETTGAVTFGVNNATTATLTVPIVGDTTQENDETFFVNITLPSQSTLATLGDAQGVVTILNDDGVVTPSVSITDVTVTEGNSGTTNAVFTVSLSQAATQAVTVVAATGGGTATAGTDYTATTQTLNFAIGETSKQFTVPVIGDTAIEANETFNVTLTPTGATVLDGTGVGTITNDDTPTLSISDVTVTEGNSGTTNAVLTVTLSAASPQQVTVQFATSNGTGAGGATAPGDYTTTTGTVTFAPNSTTPQLITIPVVGDTTSEATETFTVTLSTPSNATIADGTGIVTITDNDLPGLSISPPTLSVTEGNSGTTNAVFTVTLTGGTQQDVTVVVSTADGTGNGVIPANAGQDYTAVNQTLTFTAADSGPRQVTVSIAGDTTIEPNEIFTVTLTNPTGGPQIIQPMSTVTITNDDLPTVSVAPPTTSVLEGNSGITEVVLTVTLSQAAVQPVSVPFTLNGTTATGGAPGTANADFDNTAGSVTFDVGQTSKTVTLHVFGDLTNETNELFNFNLGAPTNATVATGQGQTSVVITNDDAPSLTISDVTIGEGGGNAIFTVTMSSVWNQEVQVVYTTSNGTATAGSDYTATSNTLTFAANTSTLQQPITVPILQDTLSEGNENFTITLSAPTGQATIAKANGIGTITDDDLPIITISSPTVNEGNSGTTAAVFTVTLSANPTGTVTIPFATASGTATSGTDFTPATGTLTFTAGGGTTQQITVQVIGDTQVEPNESFTVTLSSPSGGVIQTGGGVGTGTITNDDLPTIAISSTSVTEGNTGTTTATVTVTLSAASSQQVLVPITTSGGTATAGTDYTALSNTTLTFAAGETSKTVNISILGDTTPEVIETFNVSATGPTGATAGAAGVVTITNDDGPSFSVNDVTVTEGNSGTTNLIFTVTLGGDITSNATVQFATQDGTATAGSDYVARTGTLTFTPTGAKTQTVTVTVNGDTTPEANETLNLNLSNSSAGVLIADTQGVGTITNDDLPTLSVSDITVTEGNSGTVNALVTVTLAGATSSQVTVNFATGDVTATAGTDYVAQNGTLTFAPGGATSQVITLAVNGDTLDEVNETFNLSLSSASGATLSDSTGVVTITDDDATPTLSISDVTVNELDAPTNAVFTVSLSAASGQQVTVQFATADSTAQQPFDYTSQTGTVTFAAGETSKLITISVRGDNTDEQNETFQVNLTNATSATLAKAGGVATIIDDDLPGEVGASSLSGKVFADVNNSGTQDTGEKPMSGVTIQLADSTGTNIIRTTTTDASGSYFFLDLAPGNYTIIEQQPASMTDGKEIVGTQGGTSTTNDRIVVTLNESVDGSGNNFAERGLRSDLVSKRLFLASNTNTTTTLQALNLREGAVWMPFDAGIDGTLTAQATGAAGEGTPSMTIYDNDLRPLASSTGSGTSSRLDYQGQPGKAYFLAVSGSNSDVDVNITNAVKQVGSTVTVSGTSANDTFEFMAGSSYTVIINGVNYTFSPTQVTSIVFNGGGGSDTAIVNGSSAAETANLTLGSGTVSGSGYSVNLNGVNNIVVNGNGGNDVATLADSAFSDDLDADGDWIGLSNDLGFATSVQGYRRVTATASHGGSDTAQIGAVDFILEKTGWQDN